MKKQQIHQVNKTQGRFGVPDPNEVCELLVNSIPLGVLEKATRILDVGIGCGGISRAVVRRLEKELYIDHYDAIMRVYGIDTNLALVKGAKMNGFINTHCEDFLTWQPNMKFDVIVGNPPYNNAGKVKGQRSTSGTSMWIQFLNQTVRFLKPGGFCSLLVPSAVGNTNSVGWRALKDVRVIKITTGMEKYFNVSTAISMISFVNDSPSDYLDVNGVVIKRTKVNILPTHSNPLAIGIMDKLQNSGSRMSWFRSNFPKFVEAATGNSNILGMPALDRGAFMRPRTLQELTSSGKFTKCEILRVEVEDPVKFMEFVKNPLFRFFHSQTGATGNQTLGILRFLTLPSNWQQLETDEDIYHAYGLTKEEIEFVNNVAT